MTSSSSPLVRSSSAAPISASLPPSSAEAPRRERITPSFSRQREGAGGEKRVSLKSSSETRVLCPVRRSGERKEKTKERTAEGVRGKEPPTPKKSAPRKRTASETGGIEGGPQSARPKRGGRSGNRGRGGRAAIEPGKAKKGPSHPKRFPGGEDPKDEGPIGMEIAEDLEGVRNAAIPFGERNVQIVTQRRGPTPQERQYRKRTENVAVNRTEVGEAVEGSLSRWRTEREVSLMRGLEGEDLWGREDDGQQEKGETNPTSDLNKDVAHSALPMAPCPTAQKERRTSSKARRKKEEKACQRAPEVREEAHEVEQGLRGRTRSRLTDRQRKGQGEEVKVGGQAKEMGKGESRKVFEGETEGQGVQGMELDQMGEKDTEEAHGKEAAPSECIVAPLSFLESPLVPSLSLQPPPQALLGSLHGPLHDGPEPNSPQGRSPTISNATPLATSPGVSPIFSALDTEMEPVDTRLSPSSSCSRSPLSPSPLDRGPELFREPPRGQPSKVPAAPRPKGRGPKRSSRGGIKDSSSSEDSSSGDSSSGDSTSEDSTSEDSTSEDSSKNNGSGRKKPGARSKEPEVRETKITQRKVSKQKKKEALSTAKPKPGSKASTKRTPRSAKGAKAEAPRKSVKKEEDMGKLTWEWVCTANVPTMKHIPKGVRREWGEVMDFRLQKAVEEGSPQQWMLFQGLSKLCLRTPPRGGRKRKGLNIKMTEWTMRLLSKARMGKWAELLAEAQKAEEKMGTRKGIQTPKGLTAKAKRTRERVIELVGEGQYSRACKALVSEGVSELDEEVMEQLRKKHPQGVAWKKVRDMEQEKESETNSHPDEEQKGEARSGLLEGSEMDEDGDARVTFTGNQVERALKAFHKGTAPGGSGMRAQHWLDALDGMVGDGRKNLAEKMARACEVLANGEAPEEIAEWIAGAPIFPLKKRFGGIRPVAVGEVIRRLVAKMLANDGRVKVKAEKIFKEVGQLGVGIKGGAEIVVQAMRTWLKKEGRKGRGVLKLDFENAYNRIDREEIGKMVKEFFPELFPWFRFCYGTRAALICQGKRLPFHSCDGVQQGDPLGPLFFALGILRMGKRMKEALAESLSLWYLDDGSIVGPGTELLQAWKIVEEEAKKIGMRLNVEKCEIWAWEGEEEEWMTKFPEQVRRVRESGFELLGCPVGDKDFSEKCAKERVSRVKEVLDRLDVVDDPQIELALIRSCLGFPKFGFTVRSAPPDDIVEAVREFDQMLKEVAERRLHVVLNEEREKQWHLPLRMGGIGIPRAEDVAAPAYLGNAIAALPFVKEVVPGVEGLGDMKGAKKAWKKMCKILEEEENELEPEVEEELKDLGLEMPEGVVEEFLEGIDQVESAIPEGQKIQHFLHSLIHLHRLREWLGFEKTENDEEEDSRREMLRKMLVMRGNETTGYVGDWLNVVPCEALGTRLNRAVFLVVLNWWLGGRMPQAAKCEVRTAKGKTCGHELDKWGDHSVCCKVGPGVIARHNGVNLAWMLAERRAGFTVQREQRVQFGSKKKPADTLVWSWKGMDACAQDWAVVHPMTKKGLGARKLDPYEAVTQAEERKKRLESSMCADAGVGFVPLAMDTFGGFGPSAAEALEVVADQMRTLKGEEDQEKEFRAKRLAQKLRITMFRAMGHQILARASVGRLEEMEAQTEWEEESEEEEEEEASDVETLRTGGRKHLEKEVSDHDRPKGVNHVHVEVEAGGEDRGERVDLVSEKEQEGEPWGAREPAPSSASQRKAKMEASKNRKKRRRKQRCQTRKQVKSRGDECREERSERVEGKKRKGSLAEWLVRQGLEKMDVGQGRGGECQYLSVLATMDPDAWKKVGCRVRWDYSKVDDLREVVADWIIEHQDLQFVEGMSFRELILREARWRGDEEATWARYLNGVRDGRSGQWGDEATLLALSGVTGRAVIVLTGKGTEKPDIVEYSPPATWESTSCDGPPIVLLHERDNHFTPVRILEGGEWIWVIERERVDQRMISRRNYADGHVGRTEHKRGTLVPKPGVPNEAEVSDLEGLESLQVRNFPFHQRPEGPRSAQALGKPNRKKWNDALQKMEGRRENTSKQFSGSGQGEVDDSCSGLHFLQGRNSPLFQRPEEWSQRQEDSGVFWQSLDETDIQNEANIWMDIGEEVVWMEVDGESSQVLVC